MQKKSEKTLAFQFFLVLLPCNQNNRTMIKTDKIKFNSHSVHNPTCDIVQYHIDNDMFITYGVYLVPATHRRSLGDPNVYTIKNIQPGDEFMEVYVGENYNPDSTKRSYSRMYYASEIPAKWQSTWKMVKEYYQENFQKSSEKTLAGQN